MDYTHYYSVLHIIYHSHLQTIKDHLVEGNTIQPTRAQSDRGRDVK